MSTTYRLPECVLCRESEEDTRPFDYFKASPEHDLVQNEHDREHARPAPRQQVPS